MAEQELQATTKERIEFNVVAESRHPQDLNAYDPLAHRYRPEYVHPRQWQLRVEMGTTPLPENLQAYTWQIEQTDGSFRHELCYEEKVNSIDDLSVEVPEQGNYVVKLTATLRNGRQLTFNREICLRDFLVVAVGDSYFCGEGNPDVPGEPSSVVGPIACNLATFTKILVEKANFPVPMKREAKWQEKQVHRSYKSGPSLAVAELQQPALGIVITFLNFARSGASIAEGLLGPRETDDWTEIGEIEEANRTVGDRPIDALLISIGGNDIQFPDRLIDLIRDDLIFIGAGGGLGDDALNRKQELAEAKGHLEALPDKLKELAQAVETLDARQVYLMQYPTAHFETIDERGKAVVESGCGIFDGPDMDIDGKDAQIIKESGAALNRILQRMAREQGWILVDGIAESFSGHGLCAQEPYFISADESCRIQGDFEGTMHPNADGHKAYGACIRKSVNKYTIAPALTVSMESTKE